MSQIDASAENLDKTASASAGWKTVLAGVIGNALEWYDFALIGYFAPVISRLYFPRENEIAGLLETFGIFALGFLMRPLGGILFGYIGDRTGRTKALQYSVLLMAFPTCLVGVLPTYHQIGLAAPILLTIIRMLQGISVGGELIGSYSFLGERAAPNQRGFIGSWTSVSAGGGMLIGSGLAAFMTSVMPVEDLDSWGWRLPFLGGIFVGAFGFWFRSGYHEGEAFQKLAKGEGIASNPILAALRENPFDILRIFFLALPLGVGFYIPFVWLSTWLTHIHEPPTPDALAANTMALAVMLALTPFAGALSDKVGRKRVYITGALGIALASYPVFQWISQGTFQSALQGQLVFALFGALTNGSSPAMFVESFPTRTRFSGIAIGYNASQAVFGGTAPLMATWIISATGNLVSPAYYLAACMLLGAIAACTVVERSNQPLH